jgi:hypothetical protein
VQPSFLLHLMEGCFQRNGSDIGHLSISFVVAIKNASNSAFDNIRRNAQSRFRLRAGYGREWCHTKVPDTLNIELNLSISTMPWVEMEIVGTVVVKPRANDPLQWFAFSSLLIYALEIGVSPNVLGRVPRFSQNARSTDL